MGNSNSINITHVVRRAEGGMQRYVAALVSGLSARFVQTLAAAPGFLDSFPGLAAKEISLIPVDIGDRIGLGMLVQSIRLARELRRTRVDLVHSHGYKAAMPGAIAAKLAGAKSVITGHNMFPSDASFLAKVSLRLVTRLSDRILAVSPALAASLTAAGVDSRKIEIILPGIDLSLYNRERADTTQASPMVLCVARLTKVKGVEYLIRAAALISARRPDVRVLIVGDGPDREELESLAKQVAPDTVEFLGYREDVPDLLSQANVVVVPSLAEGLGLVAAEAMAARKPVVASEVGGLPDIIKQDMNGLLVPPANPEAIADAVLSLVDSPELAKRLGEAGRRFAEEELSVEKMISRMEEVYSCIVS